MSYLELRDITKTYGEGAAEVHALKGVDLRVDSGSLVAVMGSSGSGKSTLLTIAGSLEEPTHGEVDDPLAVTSPSKFIEAPNCSQILRVAWRPEFRVGQAQIVSLKLRVFPQPAGQQTAAQCTVG